MCGIAGFVDYHGKSNDDILQKMVDILRHRGPDDKGIELYKNSNYTVGLGQTRLAVIDLSPAGHQPMHYKHFTIIYNGEIYNYKEIKEKLINLGHKFTSNSDTEVILHSFEEWGNKAVEYFIGMFVFAIWDKKNKKIIIYRDRAGVKPLYYFQRNQLFLFASEIKALHEHPGFEKNIDQNALGYYFDFGYIPAPYSIFQNTYKLEAGHYLIFDLKTRELDILPYWQVNSFYELPKFNISYSEAKEELRRLLISAFNYRMVADVPVGVFLSGGYDSTAVTAILQNVRTDKIKTFTIGFGEGNNEAPFAKEIAGFLGTDHTEYYCTTREAQEIIPTLSYFYDEPFADSSAIPTILVSRLARQQVTVALSADAGDEIFAGYTNYVSLSRYLKQLNHIPAAFKPLTQFVTSGIFKIIPGEIASFKHKVFGLSKAINRDRKQQTIDLFRWMKSLPVHYKERLFADNFEKDYSYFYSLNYKRFSEDLEIALAIDYKMYLQNDILTKVDRATMSVSLEGREPLLDHRIVEFAARLPLKYKFQGKHGKLILKDIVHDYVPHKLLNRPKAGFRLPIYKWLLGDLSYLIEEYLSRKALRQSELFNIPFLEQQVSLFKANKLHYKTFIWKLLMFQMWYDRWMI